MKFQSRVRIPFIIKGMKMMFEWITTIGVLVTVVGFGCWLFIYSFKLAVDPEDAYRIDPIPKENEEWHQ